MVQLSTPTPQTPGTRLLGLVVGLAAIAIGVSLLLRAESALGTTGAALFVVLGLVVVLSLVGAGQGPAPVERQVTWEGEPARFLPRPGGRAQLLGLVVMALLGGWFAAIGVVGALEESWVWPVLAVVPAVYFLGFPALAALGRFRVGGTWITSTRVVDEQRGLRSELALADVDTVTPRSTTVHLAPVAPVAVERRRLVPWPWCARPRGGDLVVDAGAHPEGSGALAAEVRATVAASRR